MIWRGQGYLSGLLPLLGIVLPTILGLDSNLNSALGGILGCIIAIMAGIRLNKKDQALHIAASKNGRDLQTVIYQHETFYLRMEVFSILALLLFVTWAIESANPSLYYLTSVINTAILAVMVIMIGYRYYKEKRIRRWLKNTNTNATITSYQGKTRKGETSRPVSSNNTTSTKKTLRSINNTTTAPPPSAKKSALAKIKEEASVKKEFKPTDHSKYLPR